MEQYINKDTVVAEIEDWRDKIKKGIFSIPLTGSDRAYATFEYEILGKVRDFLDTLEVKDANEALRTEYEKGRADVITKTLEWINVFNDNNYIMQYSDSCEHPINEIIEWYKNYINRE